MTTENKAAAPAPRQYWAVHMKNNDAVIPMPSFDEAKHLADGSNAHFAQQAAAQGQTGEPPIAAVVIQSPWTGEEHFDRCAHVLTGFLRNADQVLAQLQQHNQSLANMAQQAGQDAERYRFHRTVSMDSSLQNKIEPLVEDTLADQPEPTTPAEFDATLDTLLQAASKAGLWPQEPVATEVAA